MSAVVSPMGMLSSSMGAKGSFASIGEREWERWVVRRSSVEEETSAKTAGEVSRMALLIRLMRRPVPISGVELPDSDCERGE